MRKFTDEEVVFMLKQEARTAYLEEASPGYAEFNPNRVMQTITPFGNRITSSKYVYGHEIQGHGGPEGWCQLHPPHKKRKQAEECGRRWEAREPQRYQDILREKIRKFKEVGGR